MARCWLLLLGVLVVAVSVAAQSADSTANDTVAADLPVANPGRPTVATPATITPVGYFQFETGVMEAWTSPEFSSQFSITEAIKFSVSRRIEFLALSAPYVHATAGGQSFNGTGGAGLGAQVVVHHGEGVNPTVAVAYVGVFADGDTPDIDIGSFQHSATLLFTNDVHGFHFDVNFFVNLVEQAGVRRAEFGQTVSVAHPLGKGFGIAGELWHFTQPFLHSNTVGNLWAVNYNMRKNLVLDAGFNHGFTSTSTQWEVFAGFTYVLPRKVQWR